MFVDKLINKRNFSLFVIEIAWCQYEAKLKPITRNGTSEDLQALQPQEVKEYKRSSNTYNKLVKTVLDQFERYRNRYK